MTGPCTGDWATLSCHSLPWPGHGILASLHNVPAQSSKFFQRNRLKVWSEAPHACSWPGEAPPPLLGPSQRGQKAGWIPGLYSLCSEECPPPPGSWGSTFSPRKERVKCCVVSQSPIFKRFYQHRVERGRIAVSCSVPCSSLFSLRGLFGAEGSTQVGPQSPKVGSKCQTP